MKQLSLFDPFVLRMSRLVAASPRRAFYELRLEQIGVRFLVAKSSGAGRRVLDERTWDFGSLEEAGKFYDRKLREKTNPGRRSPRKYAVAALDDRL